MDRQQWADNARSKNGAQVVWIDQSTDSALQEVNSEGVCFAITREWVRSYRRYRIDRSKFVNSFREAEAEDATNRIPLEFIIDQGIYSSELSRGRRQVQQVILDLQRRRLRGEDPPNNVLEMLLTIRKRAYGRDLLNFTTYELDNILDVATILVQMKNTGRNTPRYYMLTFRRRGGAHVVGFEFRPDMRISTNYPQLFEFIDANLGLYAFGNIDNMIDFFNEDVWTELYGNRDYTSFELAEFDTGLGGFGKTWGEWLSELVQWFKSWLPG